MKCLHRVVAAGAVLAVGMCGLARGQVLEQVPSTAVGVFEVKDLQGLSTKVAKFAKTLGIDQFDPRFADPLAAVQDEFDLKQGVNKSGDMAVAFFGDKERKEGKADDKAGADAAPPPAIVLVPVSDYKAFLGNFADVKDAGNGISEVTVKKNQEKLYVVERGKYAEAAMDKALLALRGGLRLEGAAAKEVQTRDAVMYVDLKGLRPELEKGMKEARAEMDKQFKDPNAAKANPFAGQMNAQMQKMLGSYMEAAEKMIKDGRSATFSLNLTDTGISTAALADFEPDSETGKLVAQVQNTDAPLMSGLPDATYFAFGGVKLTPDVSTRLFNDFLQPMLDSADEGKKQNLSKALDAMKDTLSVSKGMSLGYVSTSGAPGTGLVGVLSVAHGDARKILEDQKTALPAVGQLMGPGGQKNGLDVTLGAPRTVDGVTLQSYTMKFNFDPNDPQSAQAQQMITMMYGRDGMKGVMGAVNDNTFLTATGASEQMLADAIAAAKKDENNLDRTAGVRKLAGELPKQRAMEFYVAVDNIARAVVNAMKQQGVAVQFKLPPNLPPIAVSAGTEGSTARVEGVIPTQLIQSITAAAMQAFMQNNGGQGQGGGI